MSKFAPMTSDLLVRKGAAQPSLLSQGDKSALYWTQAPRSEPRKSPEPPAMMPPPPPRESFPPPKLQAVAVIEHKQGEHQHDEHRRDERKPLDHPERHKKITVALSDHEHEALGIAAVKLGVTRNHLVRDALDALLESLERQYGGKCKCIADGSTQDVCCQAKSSN